MSVVIKRTKSKVFTLLSNCKFVVVFSFLKFRKFYRTNVVNVDIVTNVSGKKGDVDFPFQPPSPPSSDCIVQRGRCLIWEFRANSKFVEKNSSKCFLS